MRSSPRPWLPGVQHFNVPTPQEVENQGEEVDAAKAHNRRTASDLGLVDYAWSMVGFPVVMLICEGVASSYNIYTLCSKSKKKPPPLKPRLDHSNQCLERVCACL